MSTAGPRKTRIWNGIGPRFRMRSEELNRSADLYKFLLTLCPPCLCGEYPLLPSLLRLVPGSQILLHEICSLLWRVSAVQNLCTPLQKIFCVVCGRVVSEALI